MAGVSSSSSGIKGVSHMWERWPNMKRLIHIIMFVSIMNGLNLTNQAYCFLTEVTGFGHLSDYLLIWVPW